MNPAGDPVPIEPSCWSADNNDYLFFDFGDFGDNRPPGQLMWNPPFNFAASSPLGNSWPRAGHTNRAESMFSGLQSQLLSAGGHSKSDSFQFGAQPVGEG